MINKRHSNDIKSKCKRDAKGRHFWERRGVFFDDEPWVLWQCSQCELCTAEGLQFIKNDASLVNDEVKKC